MSSSAAPASRAKSIGHYVLLKTIGEGTFGKVKLGTHILTGERVAVKVLEKARIAEVADVERVAREIHILKLIRHPHLIQLYEIIETPRELYLIMEFASGGELFDYIVQHSRAEEAEACRFLHQILAGVEKVHKMRVVHRDLKPENLLLDGTNKDIKIADFGLSNTYKEGQLLQTACGSPCYAAPEMIAGQKYVPSMVDIWSCGVILFALVCGYLPFEDQNHGELYKKILNAEYEIPDIVSKEVADLISGMLTTDPTRRMTLQDIRKHVWYTQIPEASIPSDVIAATNGHIEGRHMDEEILEQLDSYGFPREYAVKCLETNKHNHVTTTYYLLKEKRARSALEGAAANRSAQAAIADLDAAGFDELEPSGAAASMAAAVAGVATPSRSGGQRRSRPHSARAGAAGDWLDSDGGMQLPGGAAWAGGTPRETGVANGVSRPVPRLNLNGLPDDERPATRPTSARSGGTARAASAAAAAAAAAANVAMASGDAGPSCSRTSPGSRPPTAPGSSYRGGYAQGDGQDAPTAWMPSPQRLAFEGPGTPRAMLTAPLSARGGSRGGYGASDLVGASGSRSSRRRHHSSTGRAGGRARGVVGGGYGAWDETRVQRGDGDFSPNGRSRSDPVQGPPISARARLQGNANGYRDRSSPVASSRQPVSAGRPVAPLSARGAGSRDGAARGASSSRAQSSTRGDGNTFHVSCNGSRQPRQVTQEVMRVLAAHRIGTRQVSSFMVRAQGQGFRLEAEVLQLDRGGGYVLRFSRISGDMWVFKDVCAQLLADLQI